MDNKAIMCYNYRFNYLMQNKRSNFIVQSRNAEILVTYIQNSLKISIIFSENLAISQHIFTESNLSQLTGSISFKKLDDLYYFLASARTAPEKWIIIDPNNIQVSTSQTQVVKISPKVVVDPLEYSKIALLRASTGEGKQQDLSGIHHELGTLRSGYNSIGAKLKQMGSSIEGLYHSNDNNTRMIEQLSKRIAESQTNIQQNRQKAEESIENVKQSIDIWEKTMHRNYLTLKQAHQKSFSEIKIEIAAIWADIEKYDFMRIKRENEQILKLFELEIKVKDFHFEPDHILLENVAKLHWLNKQTLKNLQDVKDYNKCVGKQHFSPGISKIRILVLSVKNNGLLFGVCSKRVKENLDSITFNDQAMISLNSCGYVINRGAMIITNVKIKKGDIIKMQVNLSQGVITWWCNDIEVALADMGPLNKQEVFPMIGLGYFGDEVEILQCQLRKKSIDVVHETYKKELQRMNDKFGVKYRQ